MVQKTLFYRRCNFSRLLSAANCQAGQAQIFILLMSALWRVNLMLVLNRSLLNREYIPINVLKALIVLNTTPRRGSFRKHRYSIVAPMFVSAGTCLPSRCLETARITSLFYCCVRVCCGRYLATHVPSCDRCIATVLQINYIKINAIPVRGHGDP
jgi:hypothetical protein